MRRFAGTWDAASLAACLNVCLPITDSSSGPAARGAKHWRFDPGRGALGCRKGPLSVPPVREQTRNGLAPGLLTGAVQKRKPRSSSSSAAAPTAGRSATSNSINASGTVRSSGQAGWPKHAWAASANGQMPKCFTPEMCSLDQ
jgi:hypothetical protein